MRKAYTVCLVVLSVTLCSCSIVGPSPDKNWTIAPQTSVGNILPSSSEQDLIDLYGKNNVRREKIGVGEGECVEGTVLFPGTPNAVQIEWKADFRNPERITISRAGTKWHTPEGLTIGTSLGQLERVNGSAFLLTGFGCDYPGRTVGWNAGRLPSELQLDLEATKEITESEFQTVSGEGEFRSDNAVIRKMGLRVSTLFVRW